MPEVFQIKGTTVWSEPMGGLQERGRGSLTCTQNGGVSFLRAGGWSPNSGGSVPPGQQPVASSTGHQGTRSNGSRLTVGSWGVHVYGFHFHYVHD